MRILLVEDEPVLCDQLVRMLTAEGRVVDVANDGIEGAFLGASEPYDVIILDLGLPGRDGLSVLKQWRSDGIKTPVLILTARDGWSERVDGLDAGADDYITKPFHMAEVSARIRALIRRNTGQANPRIEKGEFAFDTRTGQASVSGVPIELTAQELAVLTYLLHNPGRPVSRSELSDHIYSYDNDRDSNTIAVFVTRLRKKIGLDLIRTERGRGYILDL